MEQMNIPSELIVDFDYRHADKIIQVLKPVIWKDGDSYCCLLGPDPSIGIFGCGDTPEDATEDWQDSLKLAMSKNSPIITDIVEELTKHQNAKNAVLAEFEAQFKPPSKQSKE